MKTTKILAALSLATMIVPVGFGRAFALELVIEGNGAESTSEIVINNQTETNVTQTNNTSSTTDVEITADTGSNEASGNTGEEVSINTGDIDIELNVQTDTNTSAVEIDPCCNKDVDITIAGNIEGSQNNIDLTNQSDLSIVVDQDAHVENTFKIDANTGKNIATHNTSDVTILTGDISSTKDVHTSANHASVDVGCCSDDASTIISIKNNGEDTTNSIVLNQSHTTKVFVENNASIQNSLDEILNTGQNLVDGIGGRVYISTGDITTTLDVVTDANTTDTKVCDPDKDESDDPDGQDDPGNGNDDDDTPPYNPPSTPPTSVGGSTSNGSSGSSGSSSDSSGSTSAAGQVLGIGGAMLPATGANQLIYFLIANILTFAFGCYLRLRAGRSPAHAYVYA